MPMSAISEVQAMDFPFVTHWFSSPVVATVVAELKPKYQVKCWATYWQAELIYPFQSSALSIDSKVVVLGRRGLILLVCPS